MCGRLVNVRTEYRALLALPKGGTCSPKELEASFADVDATERGRLSRDVLSAIPSTERQVIAGWVKKKCCAPGETPTAGPADQSILELLVFYALAFYAMTKDMTVHAVARLVITQKSAADVILPARA